MCVRWARANIATAKCVHVDGEGVVWGDPARIQQIVTSLVENVAT